MNLPPALKKIKPQKRPLVIVIAIFLTTLVVIIGAVFIYKTQSSKTSSEPTPQSKNAEVEQKNHLLSPKDPNEENKTTVFGRITKVEENILTLENKGKIKVEIAETARFYRLIPQKGLESTSKEEFKPDETALAGNLSSSDIADYKAEIFTLSEQPTLVWGTP